MVIRIMKISILILSLLILLIVPPAWAANVTILWTDNSTNEAGFNIERREGTTIMSLGQVGADVTIFVDGTPLAGIEYCYRVNAFNQGGVSTWSNEACITPADPPDGAPSGTTVTQVVKVP